MSQRNKRQKGLFIAGLIFFLGGIFLFSADKKLRVIVDEAPLHLSPEAKSPVLEKLEKGAILGLLSPGKFKASWYYVSYKSPSGAVKSGYIQEAHVEPLFQAQKIITIKGEEQNIMATPSMAHLGPDLWGASKEKVISLEGEPDETKRLENLEVLRYHRHLKDYEALWEYVFYDDHMIQLVLQVRQVAGEKNASLRIYDQIKNYLQQKFGPPFDDEVKWENPTFKYDELSWGYAVSLGHLVYRARWIGANLELFLELKGENRAIFLAFEGTQAGFKEIAKRIVRAESMARVNLPQP